MINLLGSKGHEGEAVFVGLDEALKTPGVYVHLYGKRDTKPFRKMGHITVMREDLSVAKTLAKQLLHHVQVTSV
jgi:5-(carboxyamino)imidazole ribonucleotide synthase